MDWRINIDWLLLSSIFMQSAFYLFLPSIISGFLIIKLLTEGSKPGSGLPEEPMELTFVSKILIFIGALIVSRFLSGILTLIITLIVYFKCRKR